MPITVVGILLLTLLTACYMGEERHHQALDSWFGATEGRLVDGLGPPTRVYEVDGKRYLTYSTSRRVSRTYSKGSWTAQCDTTFTVSNGVVSAWRYKGNDCY